MLIGRSYTFESAHFIAGHDKCGQLHGHTWTLEVAVDRPLQPDGMVLDFHDLNKVVRVITSWFDHKVINDVIDTMEFRNAWNEINSNLPATAETLVRFLTRTIALNLNAKGYKTDSVRCTLQEGPGGWARATFKHGELSQ